MKPIQIVVGLLLLGALVGASQAEGFVQPKFIPNSDNTFSAYPGSESQMARTARVWVTYMVAKDGTVFEPMIEQINNERFAENVIKWVKLRNYEPATLNGVPVDSRWRQRFAFNIAFGERSGRVSTKLFNKHYTAFNKELEQKSPDQAKLKKLLKKMWGTRHGSELAYELLSSARYKYARLFLDRDEQINALNEMILSNDEGMAVANDQAADVELIKLTIEAGYYGEAIDAYYRATQKHSSEIRAGLRKLFEPSINQIIEIIESEKAFARPVKIHPERTTYVNLKKAGFGFDEVAGKFETVKLRCQHKYAELAFQADSEYELPESWGRCQLQLIGETGSSAQLIQF